jgi:sigma-B regulation protein RsbU (phosphoserine phosphatase)
MFLVAPYTRLPIEETVLRVNRFLNERTGGLQYATAFYGTVDCTGLLRWVNAGHPAPLLVRADARIEPLAANGTPMGLLEEAEYAVAETRLGPGDKLLLYSDGLTEARSSAGDYFGARRLRELAAGFAVRNCRELENAVYSAVQDFTRGTLQADDITIAVLGYYPA